MPKTAIKAAGWAEVEEALKGFLSRHPEVAKDTQVSRGSKGDPILKGAVATMTFEGEGSLFDTLNYGSGDAARDQAVVKDLTDTLAALGCYYEMGHDWSLGVYPSEETAEEHGARDLLERLAEALGADPDDLEVEGTQSTDEGPVTTVAHGKRSYLVGDDMALHALAVERFKSDLEDDPKSYLGEDWMGWLDRAKVREEAETVSQELAEGNADDLGFDEKRDWLGKNDLLPEPSNPEEDSEPTNDQVEDAFSAHWSEWVEETAAAMAGSDPYSFLEEMYGGPDEFKERAIKEGLIDLDRMADEVVSNDGFESILGGDLQQKDGLSYLEQ